MSLFKNLAYRLFYALGFYPQRMRSPQQLYGFLEHKRPATKEDELRKVSAFVGIANKQKYYDALLKTFVPNWNVAIEKSEFVGEGYGESSLNAFRKVTIKKEAYFEKVYFNSRWELQTVLWFQNNIYKLLQDKINAPKVEKTYKGEFLTITYFQFLDLKPLSTLNSEDKMVDLSITLYELSAAHNLDFDVKIMPEHIRDFKCHFQYQANRNSARKKLLEAEIDFDRLENTVANSKCVLTHGDIQVTNVFENSTLIDWDSFGIFPIGLEPAFLYYRLLFESKTDGNFSTWLNTHYKPKLPEEDRAIFERNFEFFLFVFAVSLFRNEEHELLQKQLTNSLVKIGKS